MQERKENTPILFGFMLGLTLLLALRDIRGISLNKFLYLAFCVGPMLFVDYGEMLAMLSFMFPLLWGLPGTYILLASVILLIFKKGSISAGVLCAAVLFLILEFFASLWYSKKDIVDIVGYICTVMVLLMFIEEEHRQVDFRLCVHCFMLGCVVICGVIILCGLKNAPADWLWRFSRGWFRFGKTHSSGSGMTLQLNANSLAYYSLAGIGCGLLLFQKAQFKGERLLAAGELAILLISGFLSLSRSWVLFLAVIMVLLVINSMRSPRLFVPMLLMLAAAAIGATAYFARNPELLDGFLTRATDKTVATGGGRTEILVKYLQVFFSDLRYVLTGMGVTQYASISAVGHAMHNGTEQILVCCGIVGSGVFFSLLLSPVLEYRGKRVELIYWIPLLSVVMFVQSIQFLNPDELMLPYAIGVMALRMSDTGKRIRRAA